MLIKAYSTLPTLSQWKEDSKVGNFLKPKRSADKSLLRIDRMVQGINKPQDAGTYAYKLGGLFFLTMYWNNNYKIVPNMESGRRSAIMRLNLFAANKLAATHQCGLGFLASKLQQIYGVAMSEHGVKTDGPDGQEGNYLSTQNRERYRVIFRKGLAYTFSPKLASNPDMTLSLLDEENFDSDNNDRGGVGYVMSMSHELYVVGFSGGKSKVNYHSSIMGGKPVLCAGMLEVKRGVISLINNSSGHYKPSDIALAKVLRQLRTIGVDVRKITVYQEQKGVQISGDKFINVNGNWEMILKSSSTLGHSPGCQCRTCKGKGHAKIS